MQPQCCIVVIPLDLVFAVVISFSAAAGFMLKNCISNRVWSILNGNPTVPPHIQPAAEPEMNQHLFIYIYYLNTSIIRRQTFEAFILYNNDHFLSAISQQIQTLQVRVSSPSWANNPPDASHSPHTTFIYSINKWKDSDYNWQPL